MPDSFARSTRILLLACGVGIVSGLVGVGGGALLVPLLALLFGYDQHRAQGTSLVALVPPTGLLAFLAYAHAHYVNWLVGLLIIPGIFLGGIAGSRVAQKLSPERMRRAFAAFLFLLGAWYVLSVWVR